jgi:hypothetical protein
MKRYIDIKDQTGNIDYEEGEREFAFYCTVVDQFEIFSGSQTWTSIEELENDVKDAGREDELDRLLSLIPDEIK